MNVISEIRNLALLFICIYASGCATVFLGSNEKIRIYADSGIQIESAPGIPINTHVYNVPRDNKPIQIVVSNDSVTQTFEIKPRLNAACWMNIPFNYGLGMIPDIANKKGYRYPNYYYFRETDGKISLIKSMPQDLQKDHIFITLPIVNTFQLRRADGLYQRTGFWGIEGGISHQYKPHMSLRMTVGIANDFYMLFPAFVDEKPDWGCTSTYLNITNEHNWRNLTAGYGLNFANFLWTGNGPHIKNNLMGICLRTSIKTGRFGYAGVVFKTGNINISQNGTFDKQYLLSFQYGWKIPVTIFR